MLFLLLFFASCEKNEFIDIDYHGNSELWLKISESSLDHIDELDIKFTTKNVDGVSEEHIIKYTREDGFSTIGDISSPTEMKDKWEKVYQNFTKADFISVLYKDREYKTRGFSFSEQRCLEIELKDISIPGGDINVNDFDIVEIELCIEIAKNLNYEKSNFFFSTLLCCNFSCNSARFQNIC